MTHYVSDRLEIHGIGVSANARCLQHELSYNSFVSDVVVGTSEDTGKKSNLLQTGVYEWTVFRHGIHGIPSDGQSGAFLLSCFVWFFVVHRSSYSRF
jgi:hypothetical protein